MDTKWMVLLLLLFSYTLNGAEHQHIEYERYHQLVDQEAERAFKQATLQLLNGITQYTQTRAQEGNLVKFARFVSQEKAPETTVATIQYEQIAHLLATRQFQRALAPHINVDDFCPERYATVESALTREDNKVIGGDVSMRLQKIIAAYKTDLVQTGTQVIMHADAEGQAIALMINAFFQAAEIKFQEAKAHYGQEKIRNLKQQATKYRVTLEQLGQSDIFSQERHIIEHHQARLIQRIGYLQHRIAQLERRR